MLNSFFSFILDSKENFLTFNAQEFKGMKFLFLSLAIIALFDFYPTNAKLFPIEVKWWLLVTDLIYTVKSFKIIALI